MPDECFEVVPVLFNAAGLIESRAEIDHGYV